MRWPKNIQRQPARGFTLVELVAVLAIMAIIAAFSIPSLIPWYQNYKATERQANAELIYTSAQANMVDIKARGRLAGNSASLSSMVSSIPPSEAYPGSWTGGQIADDPGLVCLTSVSAAGCSTTLDLLLPNIDQRLSKVGFMNIADGYKGCYYVEINPLTGYVYGVFYSEKQFIAGSVDQVGTYKWASAHRTDTSALTAQDIAYYGGGMEAVFPETSKDLSFAHIGYFEFDTSTITTGSTITGGYFYDIPTSGILGADSKGIDALHDANKIGTTAYGLISPKLLPDAQIPSGISLKACICNNEMGIENAPNETYYFYQYDSTAIHHDQAGVWSPWTVTAPTESFKNLSFYIDSNFAAAIVPGPSNTFNDIYQVRTSQQLQHIGTPLNSADNDTYLGATFYQTHDVTIDTAWDPIGQGTSLSDPFTGAFYGGYKTSSGRTQLTMPTTDDGKLFTVTLGSGFAFNRLKETANQATASSVTIGANTFSHVYGYGIFSIVSGSTISFMHVITTGTTDTQTSSFQSPQTWGSTSSEGILLGVALNSTVKNCTLEAASGSFTVTCPIASSWNENVAGGLIGCADSTSVIAKPSLVVAGTLTVQTSNNASAYTGGIIGFSAAAISNASVSQTGGSLTVASSATYGAACSGGIVGYSTGTSASLTSPEVDIAAQGNFASRASASSSGNICSGGMVGQTDAAISSPSVTVSGQANILSQRTGDGLAYSGGIVGHLVGTSASLTSPDLNITAQGNFTSQALAPSSGGTFYAGGMVGQTDATISSPSITVSGQANIRSAPLADGSAAYSGGIVGYSASTSENSIAIARMTIETSTGFTCAADATSSFGGGIAGRMDGSATDPKVTITQSSLMTVSNTISKYYGDRYLGGMFGYVKDSGSDNTVSTPKMQVSGTLNCKVTTTSNGIKFLGGIAGLSEVPLSAATLTIDSAANMQLSTLSTDSSGAAEIGGLAGRANAALTSASMELQGSLSCSAASYNTYTGGMVGVLSNTTMTLSSIEIPDKGNAVLNSNNTSAYAYVGGMVGYSQNSTVSDSYIAAEDGTLELDSTSSTAVAGFSGGGESGSIYSRCYVNAPLKTIKSKGLVGFANCGYGVGTFASCYVIGVVTQSGSYATGNAYGFMSGYPQQATACYSTLMLAKTGWTTGTYIAFTNANTSWFWTSPFSACYQLNPKNNQYDPISSASNSGIYTASYSYMTSLSTSTSDSMHAALNAASLAAYDYVLPSSAISKPGSVFATTDAAKLANQQNPFPTATKDNDGKYIAYGNWPINPSAEAFKIIYGGANKLITAWLRNTSTVPLSAGSIYSDSAKGLTLMQYAYTYLDSSLAGYMYKGCCSWRLQYDGDTGKKDGPYYISNFSFYLSNDISVRSGSITTYTTNTADIKNGSWLTGYGGLFLVYSKNGNSPGSDGLIYGPGDAITVGSGGTNTKKWQLASPSDKMLYAYKDPSASTSDGNPCLMIPSIWTWS